jgi:hypothetical protein
MADLAMKHRIYDIDSHVYFYDGSLPVKKGVITIPSGRWEWAANAYLRGYELDAETGKTLTPSEIHRRIREDI